MLLFLLGCIVDDPLPYVGDCAVYPDGVYDYGQIGIGSCLAGPTELKFLGSEEDGHRLLITNANPYLTFDGGSLLSIPWENIDLTQSENFVHTLDPQIIDLPNFSGSMAVTDEDILMVAVRQSEGARTRVHDSLRRGTVI